MGLGGGDDLGHFQRRVGGGDHTKEKKKPSRVQAEDILTSVESS